MSGARQGLWLHCWRRFSGRAGERKAESEIPEKTASVLKTSPNPKNAWKTKQKNYGKVINCRSTNLDFPSPGVTARQEMFSMVPKPAARTHLVTMQVCEFFMRCGFYLTPFIRK